MRTTASARGFTLVELLVVIAIIGLMSSVVLAGLAEARKRQRDVKRMSDMKAIQGALELYTSDNGGRYPIVATSFVWELAPFLTPKYIQPLPEDPRAAAGGPRYRYWSVSPGNSYSMVVDLETDDPAVSWCLIQLGPGYPNWNPPIANYPVCKL